MLNYNSIIDFTTELTKRGYDAEAINEINLVARDWFEKTHKPYFFQMTGIDQESGNEGYFISTAPPKMARSNAPKGFIFLVE